ncbi:unnamed protein product [Owenia fusiformis]|uniref:Uncharacterized protein n=1 Tax=Owenia fusiformis TaxID=6347 RepID=A0A8J1XY12_OWEFU|nr:unnamed protein product [Owenia fusiformis]
MDIKKHFCQSKMDILKFYAIKPVRWLKKRKVTVIFVAACYMFIVLTITPEQNLRTEKLIDILKVPVNHNRVRSMDILTAKHTLVPNDNYEITSNVKHFEYIQLNITLSSSYIVDNSDVSLSKGWWLVREEHWYSKHKNTFTVPCISDLRAIYQYIPIRESAPLKGVYFSVKSSSKKLLERNTTVFHYSAMALLKFANGSNYTIQLQFSPKGGTQHQSDTYMLPKDGAALSSITLSLGCSGYNGKVSFTDVKISPIVDNITMPLDLKSENFIVECPEKTAIVSKTMKFRITNFTLNPQNISSVETITLVTQATIDRLDMMLDILPFWNGPVSIAIYISAVYIHSDMQERGVNFDEHIKQKFRNVKHRCEITILYGAYLNEKYPINTLRNYAIQSVQSEFMLLSDADFLPSIDFQINATAVIKQHLQSDTWRPYINKTAFVAPAFAYLKNPFKNPDFPKSKSKVRQLYREGSIETFNGQTSDNQRSTEYIKWFYTNYSYEVQKYQVKYEPYVVIRKHSEIPLFNENFVAYGMNKVSYFMELKAAGYRFKVLPDCWVSHIPHNRTSDSKEFIRNPMARLDNRLQRYEFMAEYTRKYKLGGCTELEPTHSYVKKQSNNRKKHSRDIKRNVKKHSHNS